MIKACMVLEAHRGAQKEYRLSSFLYFSWLILVSERKEKNRLSSFLYFSWLAFDYRVLRFA